MGTTTTSTTTTVVLLYRRVKYYDSNTTPEKGSRGIGQGMLVLKQWQAARGAARKMGTKAHN